MSVDNSVYGIYESYLNKHVEECLASKKDKGEDIRYATVFSVWEKALEEMIKDGKL